MKWEQVNDNNGYQRLSIEADWPELAADYDDILAGYEKVQLPGFRPGKVPRAVIEKRFQREIIEDLTQRAARRFAREALRQSGIDALGPVEVGEFVCEKDEPFRFQVQFHPMPEFTLPDLGKLLIDAGGADARDQLSVRLLELVPFEVPNALVKDELALDVIHAGERGSAEWQAASDRIRLMLILKRIARQEGIVVDDADVKLRIADKAKEFGTTRELLQRELEAAGGMQRLRDMLLAESTLDYLLERNRHEI